VPGVAEARAASRIRFWRIYGIAARELSHFHRSQAVQLRATTRLGIAMPALDDESIARIKALVDNSEQRGHRGCADTPAGRRAQRRRAAGRRGARPVADDVLAQGGTLSDRDGRTTRHRQGCAIVSADEPGANDHSVVIEAWIQP
jgi:hypothetical protein